MWRCRLGLHRWGKWDSYVMKIRLPWYTEWGDELRERRTCERCGMTQDRMVKSCP